MTATIEQLAKYRKADGYYEVDAIHADQGSSAMDSAFDMWFSEGADDDMSGESDLVQLAYAENERIWNERNIQPVLDAIADGNFQVYEDGQTWDVLVVATEDMYWTDSVRRGGQEFELEVAGKRIKVARPATTGRSDLREMVAEGWSQREWARREAARDPEGAFGGRGNNVVS